MRVKTPHAESPRFPAQRQSAQGESAPKARAKAVVDGKQVNIPVPRVTAMGGTEKARSSGRWLSRFKRVDVPHRQIRAA
jgi:hypothetical protein